MFRSLRICPNFLAKIFHSLWTSPSCLAMIFLAKMVLDMKEEQDRGSKELDTEDMVGTLWDMVDMV